MNEILNNQQIDPELDIAIIGMAGRFPGAKNLNEYWNLLSEGRESVSFFTDEELKKSGVNPSTYNDPSFVKAAPVLEDADKFDASFFGYSPKDAQIMDPQQRLFLELSHSALEDGGYDPERYPKPIAVFGGTAMNTYFLFSGLTPKFVTEYIPTLLGNDKDFLSTKVSYKLNLKGPSVNVQTACSTSLVAIHLACQSLLSEECDMALAGAAAIRVPLKTGHYYQDNGILTKDGHCRPFDAKATGTIFGSGGGVILLKKLKNALNDRDNIYALIKGTAINNDGRSKVDYTAPSVDGQAQVIIEAQSNAGVKADEIQYIEAHGTGTYLGDPIEIAALTKAFRTTTSKKGFCAIGSVKSNIGHLDAAAGIAGLIKTVLSLKNKKIPPSINFESPNTEIDFENSPFYVSNRLADWNSEHNPRRAGISSLGMGGTNSHIILQEAPDLTFAANAKDNMANQVMMLSARSEDALRNLCLNLADWIDNNPGQKLKDVAFTLRTGRKIFNYKKVLACKTQVEAINLLRDEESDEVVSFETETLNRDVVFLFPGAGSQYAGMGKNLYYTEPVFKNEIDKCLKIAREKLNLDLREVFLSDERNYEEIDLKLLKPLFSLTSIFITEYALAKLLWSWGIKPAAMIGHSLGEYTVACLSGILKLEDAIFMVEKRSELLQNLPEGGMLSIPLGEEQVTKYLNDEVSIAVINSPNLCVISGPLKEIENVEILLSKDKINYRRLKVSIAFHSKLVEPVLDDFYNAVKNIKYGKPAIPIVSNLTGKIVTGDEMNNPKYWVDHIRNTVRFSDGINVLLQESNRVFLEVGPGTTLSTLTKQHPSKQENQIIISSMRHPLDNQADDKFFLRAIGQLHFAGIELDWNSRYPENANRKVSLPAYPFERKKHWYKAPSGQSILTDNSLANIKDFSDWFFSPSWKRSSRTIDLYILDSLKNEKWLIFSDNKKNANNLIEILKQYSHDVVVVLRGDKFKKLKANEFVVDKKSENDFKNLFETIKSLNFVPDKIVHFWNSEFTHELLNSNGSLEDKFYDSIYSLFFISNALHHAGINQKIQIGIISADLHSIIGNEKLNSPEHSVLFGPSKVINKEFPNVVCKNIDLSFDEKESEVSRQIIEELLREDDDEVVAYRGKYRWTQAFEQIKLKDLGAKVQNLATDRKTILITGGTGGIGLEIATYFSQISNSNLILTKRSSFPGRDKWNDLLAKNIEDGKILEIIKKINEIEKSGSAVEIIVSDVEDKKAVSDLIADLKERYGKIDIVIHAAGIIDDNLLLNKNIDTIGRVLSPKVCGAVNLYQAMENFKPELFILFSSINSLKAPAGQFDYSAANNFMDAFANYFNSHNQTKFISINWPGWREVGVIADLNSKLVTDSLKENLLKESISNSDGIKAFNLIINESYSQVIISPSGEADLKQNSPKLSSIVTAADSEEDAEKVFNLEGLTDSQKTLAVIWMQVLGVDHLSTRDNFFELGGSSLLAIQVISKIQEVFGVTLTIGDIFNFPTLGKLASEIEKKIIKEISESDLGSNN